MLAKDDVVHLYQLQMLVSSSFHRLGGKSDVDRVESDRKTDCCGRKIVPAHHRTGDQI